MDTFLIIIGLIGTCIFLAGIIKKQQLQKKELMKMIRDHQKEIKNFQTILFTSDKKS